MDAGVIIAIVLASVVFLVALTLFIMMPRKAYFIALFSGVYLSIFKSISMKMRKLDVNEIVNAYILAKKSHLAITLLDLEMVLISGGHPMKVLEGLNAAQSAKLKLDFEFIKAVDIAGLDIMEVIRNCITPKVIELPLINSVAQDNIEVNVKVSLTLKININNYLKGVDDETISARAVESVVTKIANTENASTLISRPQLLDKAIYDAKIDSDSKYELCSVDVIHIDSGVDRNLLIQKEQIEKNKIITTNQLEHRRMVAVAVEQEMKVKAEEMKIKVIEEEAEVPKAIVKAIQEGKIKDVVDYYKLQNLQADTEMRRRIFGKTTQNKNSESEEYE